MKKLIAGFLVAFLMIMAPSYSFADKFIHILHGDYEQKTIYRDVYNVRHITRFFMESDKKCTDGYITWDLANGENRKWEYKDACEIYDDLMDFLADDDEFVFKMEWVPLDRQ